jgi:hypothetical protein
MALGKLFELQGEVIIPKDDCYIIEPIKAVIDKYFTQYPKVIPYLHYMKSMNKDDNPYSDVPIEKREEQIVYDLGLPFDSSTDEVLKKALICVEEKYSTTFYRLYKGIKSMMDQIGEKLSNIEIDFAAREGNATNILKLMEKYEAMRKSFKQAYKDFEEEQGQINVRGGGQLAFDEDEDY